METNRQIELLTSMAAAALSGTCMENTTAGDFSDELKPLYFKISEMADTLKKYDCEIQASASQILSVTEDISITVEHNAASAKELYESSHSIRNFNAQNHANTVLAIQQIKAFIVHLQNIIEASGTARDIGAQTKTALDEGLKSIYCLLDDIKEIEKTTGETGAFVHEFIASTNMISGIVRKVEDISKQMELISFNATIEARRAGLEGKSFGVIASAFRDLSDKSKRELKEIYGVIETIHQSAERVTDAIGKNTQSVQGCAEHSGNLVSRLSAIEAHYEELFGVIGRIHADAERQGGIAEEISQSVSEIETNSEAVGHDFQTIHKAIKAQKEQMDGLGELGVYLKKSSENLSSFVKDNCGDQQIFDSETIEQTAQQVFELLGETVLENEDFFSMDTQVHKQLLDKLLSLDTIESVWSNHANGKFVYSNPPAGISNARIRPWFKESIQGRQYVSDVYISAITKKPCVTVSMPITQGDGYIGVIGADLKL